MEKTKIYGAFYQVPLDEDLTVKDIKELLNKVVVKNSDKIRFIEVLADHAVAYGYINITELVKDFGEEADDFIDIEKKCNNLRAILNDVTLENEDCIYNLAIGQLVFLGYTKL